MNTKYVNANYKAL